MRGGGPPIPLGIWLMGIGVSSPKAIDGWTPCPEMMVEETSHKRYIYNITFSEVSYI